MKFTGERYVPTQGGDIRQEHLHRYAWCRHLASGRRVLDIACGEGYGSAMLACIAKSVIGVDISREAIEHASATYGTLRGLEFRVGDAAEIPLDDGSVDLVVSFETIEHHDRHREMIHEIRRVLSPDGLLVISSPNRDIYATRAGHHNEFHVKELDFAEFDAVLREQFGSIRYFGQRLAVGSDIFPLQHGEAPVSQVKAFTDTGKDVVDRAGILEDPVYYIAVAGASSHALPGSLKPSVLFSEAEDLYTHHIEVAGWAHQLDAELKTLSEQFTRSVQGGEQVSAWARRMDTELQELREKYAEAVRGGESVSAWAQAQAKAMQDEHAAWQSEKDARLAAEQQAQRDAKVAHEAVAAWQSEKEARLAAEQQAQRDAKVAHEAVAAWQSEKDARLAAERQAQKDAKAAREVVAAWQSEKEARLAAEQQAQKDARLAAELKLQAEAERACEMLAEYQARLDGALEKLGSGDRVAAEQQARLAEAFEDLNRREQQIDRLQNELIEARGEITRNQARLRILEQQRAELELIKASRSWRWTRPWRLLMRTLRARGIGETDRQRLRQMWARRRFAPGSGAPRVLAAPLAQMPAHPAPAATAPGPLGSAADKGAENHAAAFVEPAPQAQGQRDYFVWAVIDWHFRIQRPQHLSRELTVVGHRVFYISNNFVDHAEPGFAIERLDGTGRLFQVHLHLRGAPQIYHAAPTVQQQEQLRASLGKLLAWTRSRGCVSLVQHPYWSETARVLPDVALVYDCMDHHGGFADNDARVLAREGELMRDADLLIVTSEWLYEQTAEYNPHRLMVRNACQYEHFARPCANPYKDPQGRRIIGYYGAIAEWFDLELVEKVARYFSDCLILLVGNDTAGAGERLAHLSNVQFTGEVSYSALPAYLDGFDVCMLPFQVIPLTLATNPVKVYEYLSAGKDVVSVSLPEIQHQFDGLVRIAADHHAFVKAIEAALQAKPDAGMIERRQRFAAQQTWAHRVRALAGGVDALRGPKVSVIVLTYNNLEMTRACLDSVERLTHYANLEVIVVDNASADDTPVFLREWEHSGTGRKVILNSENLGFAAGNNIGLAAAEGDYLVLLNNDTYVTPGWVATLMAHLRHDDALGIVGPVTNNIGNEARIDIAYSNMQEMLDRASAYTCQHMGQQVPLRTAAFFCVMLRRAVYEQVGPLDEAFGVGFFEDDDYCRRVEQTGWSIACAEDVFVHHHLSASFNKLKQEKKQALFEKNKTIYEEKWGTWLPHRYRER